MVSVFNDLLPHLFSIPSLSPLVQGSATRLQGGTEIVEAASKTVSLVVWILALAILLPLVFLIYRKLLHSLHTPKTVDKDPDAEMARLEKKGDYAAAAVICERNGKPQKAAALFEKAKDYGRSAYMYESAGNLRKAAQFYLKSGGSARAAGLHMKMGEYLEAAKIFRNKGDHLRAAKAFEMFGNKAAAAREYREGGRFVPAARLLKEEGMLSEAAETFGLSLQGETLDHSNVSSFYTHAALLALAGEKEPSAAIYRDILLLKGDYRKVRGNLRALGCDEQGRLPARVAPSPGETVQTGGGPPPAAASPVSSDTMKQEVDESLGPEESGADHPRKEMTLRSMIAYGRLEPRYAMRLWVQIMRALAARHRDNVFFGCLTPEGIRIDMQNTVEILVPQERRDVYTAPEVLAGQSPGPHSDVYAMGVILFEILTGSLEHLGAERPAEIVDDIPSWLDELTVKCTKKDRRDRYLNTDDISSSLVKLKGEI